MKRASLIAVVVAMLLGAFPLTFAIASPSVWEQVCTSEPGVVPGIGVGTIMLGMPFADAIAPLGAPTYMGVTPDPRASIQGDAGWHSIKNPVDGARGFAIAQYGSRQTGQLQIQSRSNSVTLIQAYLVSGCHDGTGVAIGTLWPTVLEKYGHAYLYRSVGDGVAVFFDSFGFKVVIAPSLSDAGVVTSMGVFKKGQACSTLGSLCPLYQRSGD